MTPAPALPAVTSLRPAAGPPRAGGASSPVTRRYAALGLALLGLALGAGGIATGTLGLPGAGPTTAPHGEAAPSPSTSPGGAPAHAPTPGRAGSRAPAPGRPPDRVVTPENAPALFAPRSWYVPPPARPAPPPAPPPPAPEPTAPPLPYAFLGSYAPTGGSPVFFLSRGDRVVDAHVGDRLDGVYQLESAGGGQLVFVYLPLNVRQNLATGASR